MNLLHVLLLSEISDGLSTIILDSDAKLREQFPLLKEAWEDKINANDRYDMLLRLIRATNPK